MESIGSYAEKLILDDIDAHKDGSRPIQEVRDVGAESTQRDISNVEVPEAFMSEVLGTSPSLPVIEESIEEPSIDKEEKLEGLIKEFSSVVSEATKLLQEITTVGALGVNFAPPKTKKKKKHRAVEDILKSIRKKRKNSDGYS